MHELSHLFDLASARLGARAIAASDEFFAEKENLLKPEPAIWIPDRYTDRGKWMDGSGLSRFSFSAKNSSLAAIARAPRRVEARSNR